MIKSKPFLALAAACCILTATPAQADITVNDPSYGLTSYYTYAGSGSIASYDWAANGSLYYMVATSFTFGGLNQVSAGVTTTVVAASSDFAGASVISIGNYVYFNTSDSSGAQKIYNYGPISGAASSTLASTTANYGLYAHGGKVFISGSTSFTTSYLYESDVDGSGNLTNNPAVQFGNVGSGSSGPLAFDNIGNLYYAPGFGDHSIYKWSTSQVAAALADPVGSGLTLTGALWENYDSLYGSLSGATSLLLDGNGHLLITLTNFSNSSVLASFGIDGSGNFSGQNTTILTDDGLLGELRQHDGATYLSGGNSIYQLGAVPEPATVTSLLIGLAVIVFVSRRREQRVR